ncbi:hypothetical protein [Peribacillus sp. NPDC060253]
MWGKLAKLLSQPMLLRCSRIATAHMFGHPLHESTYQRLFD